jgi:hypothetical protein
MANCTSEIVCFEETKFSMVAKFVATHSWQPGKKKTSPSSYAITQFFGATNPYKKMMNTNNKFWKIWFSILTKVTNLCPILRTFGFTPMPLCGFPFHVIFF